MLSNPAWHSHAGFDFLMHTCNVPNQSNLWYDYETMEKSETKKINLGGGNTKLEGYLNIDVLALPHVDIVHDLSKGIPLPDNSVEEVYTAHFLEHLENVVFMMQEIYRVSKPGALIKIKVPYFKSIGAFKDPTHKSFFTERTFEYFDKTSSDKGDLPQYDLGVHFVTEKITYVWSAPWIRYIPFKRAFLLNFFGILPVHYMLNFAL